MGHSTVLVEYRSSRLLIDPGDFSDDWVGLTGLNAILVTHQHHDHVDAKRLPALLSANPDARLIVEPETLEVIPHLRDRAEAFPAESSTRIGALAVRSVGGTHAEIHPDFPQVGNVGYLITDPNEHTLLHPGDSLPTVSTQVNVLAMPIMAPWGSGKEYVDYIRGIGAAHTFGIHDAMVNDRYWTLFSGLVANLTDTVFHDLRSAGPIDF